MPRCRPPGEHSCRGQKTEGDRELVQKQPRSLRPKRKSFPNKQKEKGKREKRRKTNKQKNRREVTT